MQRASAVDEARQQHGMTAELRTPIIIAEHRQWIEVVIEAKRETVQTRLISGTRLEVVPASQLGSFFAGTSKIDILLRRDAGDRHPNTEVAQIGGLPRIGATARG
ncbi:hypothetical protein BCCGELA001_29150 [Bradyrhizobium sp. CCGE-LA001]|nr:hypothetical protein BCCGELA001_29150 [Bradyrhizobium sp. CCGE-LA001]